MAEEWNGDFDPIRDDPEERRVLFAALDSFRYALQQKASHLVPVVLRLFTISKIYTEYTMRAFYSFRTLYCNLPTLTNAILYASHVPYHITVVAVQNISFDVARTKVLAHVANTVERLTTM